MTTRLNLFLGSMMDQRARRVCCVLTTVAMLICCCDRGFAQQDNGGEGIRDLMASPVEQNLSLEQRLEALIKTTQDAREIQQIRSEMIEEANLARSQSAVENRSPSFSAWDTDGAGSAGNGSGTNGTSDPSTDSARSQSRSAPNQSLTEIRERIRILQRLRQKEQMAKQLREESQVAGGNGQAQLSNPMADVVESATGASGTSAKADNVQPGISQIDQSLMPMETRQNTPASSDVSAESKAEISAKRILPSPVNSLALGESLYRTGNYQSALKALQSVDVTRLTQSDRTWLDLIAALCQRRLGDFAKAEGTLRDIANEKSSDYPVLAAKWWLKHATASNETLTKLKTVNAEYEALLERSKKYVMQ